MAKATELADMLLKRFKDVPYAEKSDAEAWIERSMLEHGYSVNEDVSQDDQLIVLLYAEYDGALQIALKTANFFEFKDAEESVDKRTVSEQYRSVATELWKSYERKKAQDPERGSANFQILTRADRPPRNGNGGSNRNSG